MRAPAAPAVIRFYERHGGDFTAGRAGGALRRFLGREDLALRALLGAGPGSTVLDAGCGAGAHARWLSQLGATVCAVDLSSLLVERVRPYVAQALVGDVATLRLPRQFDRVLCAGVLELVPDPAACVRNLAAHVAPGGRLAVMLPRASPGGIGYALWHRLCNGIKVRLADPKSLDRAACAAGLMLVLHRRLVLGHNLIAVWQRPEQGASSHSVAP